MFALLSRKSDGVSSILIFLSALAWSTLPLYSEITSERSVIATLFYAHLGAAVFCFFAPRQTAKTLRVGFSRHRSLLIWATILPFCTQAAFLVAVVFIPATNATFMLEIYPIIMMLLVPRILKSQNLELPNSIKWIAFPLGALGICVMIGSMMRVASEGDAAISYVDLMIGSTAALVAAFCSSLGVLKTRLANEVFPGNFDIRGQIGVLSVTRGLPLPFLLALALYLDQPMMSTAEIVPGLLIGVTALALADVFGNHGLRLATSVGPVLLFYYAPLLGAGWLVLFFDYPLPDGLLIGAMFVVVANAYSNLRIRRSSLVVTLFAALAYSVFSLTVPFSGFASGEALTLVLVFFSIMAAAVQVRVHSRLIELTNFMTTVCDKQGHTPEARTAIEWAERVGLEGADLLKLKQLLRADRFYSDLIVLIGLGIAVAVSGVLYGNAGPLQVIVSFSVVIGAVFVVASAIELTTDRFILNNVRQVLYADMKSAEIVSFVFSITVICFVLGAAIVVN